MPGALLTVIKIGAAAYAGLCVLVFAKQAGYVYVPDREVVGTPADLGMSFENLTLSTTDGLSLQAWFVPSETNSPAESPTVLFCHGNAGDIGDRIYSVQTFHRMGLNVMIFDYRGYGNSEGKPSEKGTYEDARTAWRYLTEDKGIDPGNIAIFGRSLGAAVACELAGEVDAAALVMESTFSSATDMAGMMFPYLPVRLLCRFKYDTVSKVDDVNMPVLIAHSQSDEMIPFSHGRRLFEAASEPKTFIETIGEHNTGGLDSDTAYQASLAVFIVEHMAGNSSENQ